MTTKSIPLTVLMPVKNGQQFLAKSIFDITKNIESFDEVIVINDKSSDSTGSLLREWAKIDERVRVLSNPRNGIVSALNLGLQEASNTWIARFDVDDHYESDRLSFQRAKINEDVSAIFSDYDFWSSEKPNLGLIPSAVTPAATSISLVSSQRTAHPSVIFHRERVLEVGGYREEDFPAEDLSLWLRISRSGHLITLPKNLLHYRISRNSVTLQSQEQSILKRRALLTQIGVNPSDFLRAFETVSEIVSEYTNLDNCEERTILFYRDLIMLSQLNGTVNLVSKLIKPVLGSRFLGLGFLPAVLKLKKEKKERVLERKLNQF